MGRIPEPAARKPFYYALEDVLEQQSKGKSWTWCEVRPDIIIGLVPNGSVQNLAAHWASYLSAYALVEGKGAKVPYPGTKAGYECLFNQGSADIIARFSIWAALHPEKTGKGRLFNIADQASPSRMTERWPALVRYFGLEGTGPVEDPTLLKPGEYTREHRKVLEEPHVKTNEVFQADLVDAGGYYLTSNRHLSVDKARSAGFSEEIDPIPPWFKAFDRYKQTGMILS